MSNTNQQYDQVINSCREIYLKKAKDYGTSWRVLRTISIVDQVFKKSKVMRDGFAKPKSWINDDIMDTCFFTSVYALDKKIEHIGYDIFIINILLHILRCSLHVHAYIRHLQ